MSNPTTRYDSSNRQTSEPPTVLIIGAGISGLATGCYLQMNGFRTKILESHRFPGGCCTAWERNGYVFDYCLEWLLGTGSDNEMNDLWLELGALSGKSVKAFNLFNRVVNHTGECVNFYNDPDVLENHLRSIAPEDHKPIREFCDYIRKFAKLSVYPAKTPPPLQSIKQKLSFIANVLPSFRLFWKTGATSLETFCQQFKSPFLKQAFPFIFFQDHECFPILPYAFNMAEAHKHNSGFPQGGSLGIARSIEQRYLDLGGEIQYGAKVTEILTQPNTNNNHRVTGVKLKNGKTQSSDIVISCADGHTTLYQFLSGRFISPTLETLYTEIIHQKSLVYTGVVSVFVGFKGEVGTDEPHSTTYLLEANMAKNLPQCLQNSVLLQHRSRFSSGFAPKGCSVIHLTYLSEFEQWYQWRTNDKPHYKHQKEKIAHWTRAFLEKKYPGIDNRIDIIEVATPMTQKRYTGNTQGSILGWKSFTKAEDLANKLINKERMQLPKLDNFYMGGQWIGGGGLPRVALSGRYVAQFVCQQYKKPFVTHKADMQQAHWHNQQWQLKSQQRKQRAHNQVDHV